MTKNNTIDRQNTNIGVKINLLVIPRWRLIPYENF